MTLEEILKEKNSRLESIPNKFYSRVESSEKQIYTRLLELLAKLKTDSSGRFIQTVANLNIADDINRELQKVVFGSEYVLAVSEFAREFTSQKNVNDKYFKKAFPEFTEVELANKIVDLSKKKAVDLLTGSSLNVNYFDPIREVVVMAVENGSSYTDTIKAIRERAIGAGEIESSLLSHSKQIAHDIFAVSDSAYSSVIANDLNIQWFKYSGDELPTTREFCHERHGQYFHKNEIEAWGSGDKTPGFDWPKSRRWPGMMKGTNKNTIFSFRGGYNCGHSIMGVSESIVPKSVIERAKSQGFVK